jgi:DNA polymerase III subunit delta'
MSSLAIHQLTKFQVDQSLKNESQAIGIIGPDGIGKGELARLIISTRLKIDQNKLSTYAYFMCVMPANLHIAIDDIREIRHFLELKTTGRADIRRALLIEHAEQMTTEAQNALLKTLEELPADTIIVMTISTIEAVLPTITSRLQILRVSTPGKDELNSIFLGKFTQQNIDQAYNLSDGLPGLMSALLEGNSNHPLFSAVEQAKEILKSPLFVRLSMIDSLSKQKDQLPHIIDALIRISEVAIKQSASKNTRAGVVRWTKILKAALEAKKSFFNKAQPKLILTNLMLEL